MLILMKPKSEQSRPMFLSDIPRTENKKATNHQNQFKNLVSHSAWKCWYWSFLAQIWETGSDHTNQTRLIKIHTQANFKLSPMAHMRRLAPKVTNKVVPVVPAGGLCVESSGSALPCPPRSWPPLLLPCSPVTPSYISIAFGFDNLHHFLHFIS